VKRRAFLSLAVAGCLPRPAEQVFEAEVSPRSQRAQPDAAASVETTARADATSGLAARAQELQRIHGDDGFTAVVQPPFVVLGNEAPAVVRQRASSTIGWAVERLEAAYFDQRPAEIIEIWLFADEQSYRDGAWTLFRQRPETPFGYYTPEHDALLMNISTGGGTLVHEIVHPYMRANFPSCPSWFDEGLASLYEQCGDEDGSIHGYTNWRLAGLQAAIRRDAVPSFAELTATTRDAFYEEDPGTHYAQARYLCYYLQEQGLLRRFYRDFVAAIDEDPTGYLTLQRVLDSPDMRRFQTQWERFVLDLSFA
jgi:hypothetical protein